MQMELKEFVEQTLNQIVDGITAAQEHATDAGAIVNPRHVRNRDGKASLPEDHATGRSVEFVEFDLLVSAGDATGKKGGLGIFVAGLGIGAQGTSETSSLASNRVKFKVAVCLPVTKTD